MNLDISNLPNDFYWEDLFPVNKYIFSIKWFSYSIWGYCKSPFWIWKIIWIIDWWFDVEIIDWKKENIWEIYKNIDIRYISFIWWVVNKTWNDRNWKKYELSINEEKKELDYTYNDNWTLQDDHDKNHMLSKTLKAHLCLILLVFFTGCTVMPGTHLSTFGKEVAEDLDAVKSDIENEKAILHLED